MILAEPVFTAVTRPFSLTLATALLALFQVSSEVVPFGSVAFSWMLSPGARVTAVGLTVTLPGALFTVTVQLAFLPLAVATVILAVPAPSAVTRP